MVKTLARRSLAYCKLGKFSKAIQDLEEAIPLEDADKVGKLTSDLERVRAQFEEMGDVVGEEEEEVEEEEQEVVGEEESEKMLDENSRSNNGLQVE